MTIQKKKWLTLLKEARDRRVIMKRFNVRPARRPPKTERKRAGEINALFDAVHARCGLSERAVFERAYQFKPALLDRAFWDFTKDVPGCPKEVLLCAEALLEEVHKNDMRTAT